MSEFDPIPEVRRWKKEVSEALAGKSFEERKAFLAAAQRQAEAHGLRLRIRTPQQRQTER